MDNEFRRKARTLRTLCQDIVELRRGDHSAKRLRLDLERFEKATKSEDARILDALADDIKAWPEVRQAFRDACDLYRRRKTGEPANEHQPVQPVPNPNGSN